MKRWNVRRVSRIIKKLVFSSFIHFVLITVGITCIFPLLWMFASSLKTQSTVFSNYSLWPMHPHWENFVKAWIKGGFGMYFFNSVCYTLVTVVGVLLISSLAGFAFARLNFRGKNLIFYMFLSTLMIPVPGAFVALYVLLIKLGLVNTRLGYILPQVNGGLAFGIYLMKTFFEKLPRDLEDAGRIDGCNKLQVWWHVAMPLAKPALSVLTIFTSLAVWNEYLLAMLVLSDKGLMPLQRGLMVFHGAHMTQYPLLMAGMTISVLPIIIVYLIMQRNIISGITAGAIKA